VDGAICCEPEGGEICHVAKGALRLRLDFHGAMAHGAMPFEGRNPNRAVAAAIAALADLERRLHDDPGRHEHLGLTWITPTVLPAGGGMWLDVRTVPAVDHDGLVASIVDTARAATQDVGVGVGVTVIDDRPAVEVDEGDPLVRALWDVHAAVADTPPRLGGVP